MPGRSRCIGEYTLPSGLDRTEWNKLSCKREDKRPILGVILGRKGLYAELVPHGWIGQILIPME